MVVALQVNNPKCGTAVEYFIFSETGYCFFLCITEAVEFFMYIP